MKKVDNSLSITNTLCKSLDNEEFKTYREEGSNPFVYYRGERQEVYQLPKRVSCAEANFLNEVGVITELDSMIMELINKHRIITSKQLVCCLVKQQCVVEQSVVQYRLKKLVNKGFVKKLKFFSGDDLNASAFNAYTLGYHGMNYLRAKGIYAKRMDYIEEVEPQYIKKVLAANQLITKLFEKQDIDFKMLYTILHEEKVREKYIVCPTAILKTEKRDFLLEVVRTGEKWEEPFKEKLSRYKKVLGKYSKLNIPFGQKPILLLQAESYKHMKQLKQIIEEVKWRESEVQYTFDSAIYQNPEEAFYSGDRGKKESYLKRLFFGGIGAVCGR